MSEKQNRDELDLIFGDSNSDRVDLENRATRRNTSYFSFDEPADDTRVATGGSADLIGANGGKKSDETKTVSDADKASNSSSTQVINFDEPSSKEDSSAKADEQSSAKEDKEGVKYVRRSHGYRELFGLMRMIIYISFVLVIAATLAWYAYRAVRDVTGIGRDASPIDIVVAEGESTAEIAQKLKDMNVIEEPMFFRVYCRLKGEDGTFHPGTHTLKANDGYDGIIDKLQDTAKRESVRVTIPEGVTIDQIADMLEQNKVCEASEFYDTLLNGDYESYDFIAELSNEQRKGRVYLLEGYLFPDTYDFLVGCSADTVIRTMLDNFDKRIPKDTRERIKESGRTLNDVLIEASIIQKEAGFAEDMPRVARVITNRRANASTFPKLEMDSTISYVENVESSQSKESLNAVYNTYQIAGMPIGAICNPGLAAIDAAMNPSVEPNIVNCYYFASILETGETQFFETYDAHKAWCEANGVGIHG